MKIMEAKIISITGRDSIRHGKDCDGCYYIQPTFHNYSCWGRTFRFYDEYRAALYKVKKIVKPYMSDEKYSSLSEGECREILNEMETVFSEYLAA